MNTPHDRSELDICQGCLNCDGTRAEVEIILKPIVGQADLKYAVNDILSLIAQRDRQHKERLLAAIGKNEYPAGGLRPQARNKFRAELRQVIDQEFGGEEQ